MQGTYDPTLVSASFLVAAVASFTALELSRRVATLSGRSRRVWLAAGSLVIGAGVWTTHFLGMTAHRLPVAISYDVPLTIASLLIGIAASAFALYIASRKTHSNAALALGAPVLCIGIAGMHGTGMAAIQMPAHIEHDSLVVVLSILMGTIGAFAALKMFFALAGPRGQKAFSVRIAAAILMGITIAGMHYMGMSAATVVVDGTTDVAAVAASGSQWMAGVLILATLLLLGVTHLTLFFDFKFGTQEQDRRHLEREINRRTRELNEQADERLKAQKEIAYFGRILDESASEIYTFHAESLLFIRVNKGAVENLGYHKDHFSQMTPVDLKPHYDRASFEAMLEPLRTGVEETLEFETDHQRADGTCYPVHVMLQFTSVTDEPEFVAIVRDLSDQKRSDALIRASEARYQSAIELMPDAHIIIDPDGRIHAFNAAAEQIFGHSSDDVIGQNVGLLMPDPVRKAHDDYLGVHRNTGRSGVMGARRQDGLLGCRKDGSQFPISLLVQEFETDEGVFFSGIIRDISHRAAVEARNRQLKAVVEQATDHIVILNSEHEIEYLNPQAEEDMGLVLDEVRGTPVGDLGIRRSDPTVYESASAALERGEVWTGLLRSESRDGRVLDSDTTMSPLKNDAGDVTHYLVIGRDITERIQLEQQLAQSRKLESIGQLAAGIAHEINTPSQFVGDNIRFLKEAFSELDLFVEKLARLAASGDSSVPAEVIRQALKDADVEYLREEIPGAIDQSLDGVSRVTRIVQAMKDFSHPGQEKVPVDLNRAIESTIAVAANEWKYVADVETDLDPDLPPVVCLSGEFNQVILNLLVNASHAVADAANDGAKGTITIKTRQTDDVAEVRIADTGNGIPEDIKARIFDPFFTTKEVGKGTGQGLSIAHATVVEKHGGSITVDSEPGQGACFTIRLPMSDATSDGLATAG